MIPIVLSADACLFMIAHSVFWIRTSQHGLVLQSVALVVVEIPLYQSALNLSALSTSLHVLAIRRELMLHIISVRYSNGPQKYVHSFATYIRVKV